MSVMHKLFRRNATLFFALALSVLGFNAIIPAGHMLAPSAVHFVSVVPCPSTNALARAFAAEADRADGMAATQIDHAAMGHGGMDHAAMGHHPSPANDADGDAPGASQPKVDCAFSSLAFAATLPVKPGIEHSALVASRSADLPLPILALVRSRYLRPPLRAPPAIG